MLVVGFPTGPLQANCYLLAADAGEPCVIVDPGQEAVDPILAAVREHRLAPVAVLLTHGHFDHMFCVTPVCDGQDVPAWIHPDDRDMLTDPLRGVSVGAEFLGGGIALREPAEVRELADGVVLDLAGLTVAVTHTPGHTGGSVTFRTGPDGPDGDSALLLSGDTLFAGSIGRSDLPGGDQRRLMESLRDKVLTLADETVVLPGHGPTTTIGAERATNPFLAAIASGERAQAPHRGL